MIIFNFIAPSHFMSFSTWYPPISLLYIFLDSSCNWYRSPVALYDLSRLIVSKPFTHSSPLHLVLRYHDLCLLITLAWSIITEPYLSFTTTLCSLFSMSSLYQLNPHHLQLLLSHCFLVVHQLIMLILMIIINYQLAMFISLHIFSWSLMNELPTSTLMLQFNLIHQLMETVN